jgi:hypothetical protein
MPFSMFLRADLVSLCFSTPTIYNSVPPAILSGFSFTALLFNSQQPRFPTHICIHVVPVSNFLFGGGNVMCEAAHVATTFTVLPSMVTGHSCHLSAISYP